MAPIETLARSEITRDEIDAIQRDIDTHREMLRGAVTRGEYESVMLLHQELRGGINARITQAFEAITQLGVSLHQSIQGGFTRVDERFDDVTRRFGEVTARQDLTNGRIAAGEKATAKLREDGCAQGQTHIAAARALAAAGALDGRADDAPVNDGGVSIQIIKHPKARRAAGIGLVGIAGAGLGQLLPHVVSGLHWLLEHLVAKP